MNSVKASFGIVMVAAFVAVVLPFGAQASTYTPSYSTTYTPSSSSGSSGSSGSGSTYTPSYSTTYTPSSSSNSSGVTHYDTGCCTTQSSTYTPSYSTTYTPTSYTSSYSTTYTPTYTTGGCTSNCGGGGCSGNCGGYTYPNPTCSLNVSNNSITRGQSVTVSWGSTNVSYANISNVGTNLPGSGSYVLYPQNDTTFTGTFYGYNGQSVTCSKTVTVTYQAPTCTITGPDTATAGQTITLNWSSTNATRGDIQNLGTNLNPNDSHSFVINNTTTFYGTFYGTNGQTTNCQKTVTVNQVNNNLSCTISINNYGNGYNNGYWQPNSAVTLSWNSNGASYGSINNGFGNVGASGSRTIYPTQTTTYTGTFYNYQGQQVTCSATVYVNGYVPPTNNTPFVTLSATPYTGLDLGPVGTVLYWGFLAFWCALAAYLIVIKKIHNQVYASLMSVLFGSSAVHAAPTGHAAPLARTAHGAPAAPAHEDATDDFILSQINRVR